MSCDNNKLYIPEANSILFNKEISIINKGNNAADGPLAVFPEEVWELIMNQISRSLDILNFFKAFPEFDTLFHNQKPNLLFELVLPHIMTKYLIRKQKHHGQPYWYLQSKELFNLRLVSKRWKRAVELCIQNHSDRHTTLPKSQNGILSKEYNIIPDHHFSYHRMHKYHFGASVFQNLEQMDIFMQQMRNFHGNPFPGRFIYCNFSKITNILTFPLFVPKLVEILKKFGKFVHVLDFQIFDNNKCNLGNFKTILDVLSYVPNLRSLTIRGKLHATNDKTTDEFFCQPESQNLFPQLPCLKVFDWQVCSEVDSRWVSRMIDTYAQQNNNTQKLSIEKRYCSNHLVSNLSNLSELHLYLDRNMVYTVNSIRNVLSLFSIGQLRKFCLSDNPHTGNREFEIKQLLGILGEFRIQAVVLERLVLKEVKTEYHLERISEAPFNTSSITSLWFDDNRYLSLEFLKLLQNLKFLHIYSDDYDSYNQLNRDKFTNNLCSYYVQAGYIGEDLEIIIPEDFSIWNEIPKLEILSASIHHTCGILDVQYAREYGNKPFLGYRPTKQGKYGY